MKKTFAMLLLALALFATACGNQATTTTGDSADKGGNQNVELEQLLTNVQKKSEEIKSLHMDMTLSQTMGMPEAAASEGVPQNIKVDSIIKMDMITEPLAAFMDMEMTMPFEMGTEGGNMKIQMYMTPEYMYMTSPMMGEGWTKISVQEATGMQYDPESMKNAMSSNEAFTALKELKDDVTITDQGDTYLISFKGSGDKAQKLFDAQMNAAGENAALEGVDIKYNAIDYNYVVDKKTELPVSLNATMDFTVGSDGEGMSIVQVMEGTFSKVNEIDKIEIPQEALDATEMDQ